MPTSSASICSDDITGLVLAGGRGTRMGGVDKGLQHFNGMPLARHALLRLQPQTGPTLLNANRNLATYEAFGVPVCPDPVQDYSGPLSGFLAGLERCATPYLVTVPCDSPRFPHDLVARLASALVRDGADIAMVVAPEDGGNSSRILREQPVFCLLRATLRTSLATFLQEGGRKVGAWTARHATVLVPFDQAGDDPLAFANANTLADLHALQTHATPP